MSNNLERWQSKVAKKITGRNHLHSFEIVELFKKKQALTEVEIRQLMTGEIRRRQASCRENKGFRIKAIVDNFNNYTIRDYPISPNLIISYLHCCFSCM